MQQPLLQIRKNDAGAPVKGGNPVDPILLYKNKPLFKFGPMSETSTFAFKLGSKAYDARFWADWQQKHGMGYVRCYPEQGYGWVDTTAEGRLYPFRQVEPLLFDLDQFDPEYWDNLRQVVQCLKERDIIIHLQLVQVCYFKDWNPESRRWIYNFWNPENNVNDWTNELKPEFPFPEHETKALEHWERYVNAILDAAGDAGNVIFDLGNELNTELSWINWTLDIMEAWENRHQIKLMKGLDYTHVQNPSKILDHDRLDLIMTHGEYVTEAPVLRETFGKPVVSVISRDGAHNVVRKLGYLGLGEVGSDVDRFRRFHYRCLMHKVQGVGDYGKMMGGQEWNRTGDVQNVGVDPNNEEIQKFAQQSKILNDFFDRIEDYEALKVVNDQVLSAPTTYYCLKSSKEILVYLDAGKLPDHRVQSSEVRIVLHQKEKGLLNPTVSFLDPISGDVTEEVDVTVEPIEGMDGFFAVTVPVPAFESDMMIYMKSGK